MSFSFLKAYFESIFFTPHAYCSPGMLLETKESCTIPLRALSYIVGDYSEYPKTTPHSSMLAAEYSQIGIYISFALLLSSVIFLASYFLVTQKPESEKLSTYECGFEPYEDAKNKFDVQFFVVAILFVLFDIEIIVLLPWCSSISTVSLLGYWSMIEFLLELGLGFLYVWCVGALDW